MNCQDVVAFVADPATAPVEVQEHLRNCGECGARMAEARRVALLLADLPIRPGSEVAARVMARIGYGNGRPTRDKVLDQLERVRSELDEVITQADGRTCVRPSGDEPSVAEIAGHLPSIESAGSAAAERALVSGGVRGVVSSAFRSASFTQGGAGTKRGGSSSRPADAAAHTHTIGTAASMQELRRVRERTLRLVSGLDPKTLDDSTAEVLRDIYRHEADHVAQMSDTLWRLQRKAGLTRSGPHSDEPSSGSLPSDLGDAH